LRCKTIESEKILGNEMSLNTAAGIPQKHQLTTLQIISCWHIRGPRNMKTILSIKVIQRWKWFGG
jgi:hypothetical protein